MQDTCCVGNCKKPNWRGGYCRECFEEFKIGKAVGKEVSDEQVAKALGVTIEELRKFQKESRRQRDTIGDPPRNPNWSVDIGD